MYDSRFTDNLLYLVLHISESRLEGYYLNFIPFYIPGSEMWKIFVLKSILLLKVFEWKCEALTMKCEEKGKSWALLELAKVSISNTKNLISDCNEDEKSVYQNTCLCGKKEKSIAYLDVAMELIKGADYYSPSCDLENIVEPEEENFDKTLPSDHVKVQQRGYHMNDSGDSHNIMNPEKYLNEKPTEKTVEKPTETPTGMDCLEIRQKGFNESGVYTIHLNLTNAQNKSLDVYCDMDTDGGGWTVIQRRGNFEIQENFYRDWIDYKNGFGNITRDFWIGNDNIYLLSNQGRTAIRFDMKDRNEEQRYAHYQDFQIENEKNLYKLHIGNYSGNAGDAMNSHNGMRFLTKDRQNYVGAYNCAEYNRGAWWYEYCCMCNPNGLYKPNADSDNTCANWIPWKDLQGLGFLEIKIR